MNKLSEKRIFFLLWMLCIVGSFSLLPYVQYLDILTLPEPIWKGCLVILAQAGLFFGLICWLSGLILAKTDLLPLRFPRPFMKSLFVAILSGLLVGYTAVFADQFIFHEIDLFGKAVPYWMGLLASLYGAINEEVLLRLFLLTSVYFLLNKFLKVHKDHRSYTFWTANCITALLFALGHLPASFQIAAPTEMQIVRILFLNGMAGLVFGWMYWTRGVWAAMIAHFVADLVLHVF